MRSDQATNPIQKQMLERAEIRHIGQIEEIGEEQGVVLMRVNSWEKLCPQCQCYHGGEC